ncbi:SIR2 family NAD-dependent protein deacylase [Mesomycoplasma neurolyticum]|uniref:Deacetylase sirtuin-type domain-containing protein n=1 Tax=Mesomycoplasma neurolyticum TaxID=2120 RepID=A0A449A5I7_9BACT|nr:deacetylase SIR2 [Mesomycoplasma neurolyticum]VEU59515.1 Uncharacterised protein [Mesomycoplasma neurolyticum]
MEIAKKIKNILDQADAILVGIGSGMTNADDISYYGQRFDQNFSDFKEKFKFIDMLQASVYHFNDWRTYWAFHSRFTKMNYYDQETGPSFLNLKTILKNKNFFIITTNSDSAIDKAHFDSNKYFHIQGKYNLMQCSQKCSNKTYENQELINEMIAKQENCMIPHELLPRCEFCDAILEVNKRNCFYELAQNEVFKTEEKNYNLFLQKNKNRKIVYWEIGCGNITPQFIKWNFWKLTEENPKSTYLVLNKKQYRMNKNIINQTKYFQIDIATILKKIADLYKE